MKVEKQTAILAKIKGFDGACLHYLDKSLSVNIVSQYNEDSLNLLKNSDNFMRKLDYTSLPTQSQLQTWLRNVHGIHISIEVSYDDLKQFKGYEYLVYRNSDEKWASLMEYVKDDYPLFATYEEALEDGLVKALMMLPNENN